MVSDLASRFAEVSLRLYGHESAFDIVVDANQDFEAVARAFERQGCTVARNEVRRSLSVACPEREGALGLCR